MDIWLLITTAADDTLTLQKQVYLNILKILPSKNENFQIKILIFFFYFCSKHRLWVLVKTASVRKLMYTPVNPSFTI